MWDVTYLNDKVTGSVCRGCRRVGLLGSRMDTPWLARASRAEANDKSAGALLLLCTCGISNSLETF
jgi:hypothetical protein